MFAGRRLNRKRRAISPITCCLVLMALGAMSAGCSISSATPTETEPPTAQVLETTPTSIAATATRPMSTPTLVASTTSSPSSTDTKVPTETPMPPLASLVAQQQAVELLKSNGNCSLPCWWGITPGKTTWSAAESFLYQFDQQVYSRTSGLTEPFTAEVLIPVPTEVSSIGHLDHFYTISDTKVQLIDVFPGKVPTYNLFAILSNGFVA